MKTIINIVLFALFSCLNIQAQVVEIRESGEPKCNLDSAIMGVIFEGNKYSYECLSSALSDSKRTYIDEISFFYLSKFAFLGNYKASLEMKNLLLAQYERLGLNENKEAKKFASYFEKRVRKNTTNDESYNNTDTINVDFPVEISDLEAMVTKRSYVNFNCKYKLAYSDFRKFINNNCWRLSGEDFPMQVYFFYSLVMAFKYKYAEAYYDIYQSFFYFYCLKHNEKLTGELKEFLKCVLKKGASKGCDVCKREYEDLCREK